MKLLRRAGLGAAQQVLLALGMGQHLGFRVLEH